MNLKKLVGSSSYFMINKTIMSKVGIEATLLLQHLIDLEDNYFKGIEFYQQVERIAEDTGLTSHGIREAKKKLVKNKAIIVTKKGLPAKDHFTIIHETIHLWFKDESTSASNSKALEIQDLKRKDKELNIDKEITNTNKKYKKVLDKLIELYPKNRVNSTGPLLKYLQKKTDTELKQIILGVPRYLVIAGDYVKNLRNYLEHECWTEEWLQAEEKTKQQHTNKNKPDTKTFKGDYGDI